MSNQNRRTFLSAVAVGSSLLAFSVKSAGAQALRVIVPVTAGGSMDAVARLIALHLPKYLGDTAVVVENRPGGGTVIATQEAARAAPDGSSILMVGNSFTINPSLHKNLSYDIEKDFAPLTQVSIIPHLLVVHPSVQAKNLTELFALARKHPGELSYASYGTGSSNHLNMEILKRRLGIDITHIPYKGSPEFAADLLTGRVKMSLSNLPEVVPSIRQGKLRPLALAHTSRVQGLPEVPTFADEGIPNFSSNSWFGFVALAGVSADIRMKLAEAFRSVVALPAVRARLGELLIEPLGTTPEAFSVVIRSEKLAYAEAIKTAGVKIE